MPYRKILLCVDNSRHSGYATGQVAALARATGAAVVVSHVYAARLHDRRFADLEPGLPKEFQEPKRLEASRRTHDSLIGRGLGMISNSYLEAARAGLEGLPVEGKSLEGKHFVELVRESFGGYDLTAIGCRGLGLDSMNGECPPAMIGSVCERFLRGARADVLVAKGPRPIGGTVMVALDGSPESTAALRKALTLARAVGARVEAVACFDPNFHPAAFKSIAAVLSEKDAKVFRFKEQEELHDRVINGGLENLYRGYLETARVIAQEQGHEIETRLLRGRPAFEIAWRAREIAPTLVVVGRFGMHRADGADLGSTAEAVVRLVPANVLVVNGKADEGAVTWTAEAEARLERAPEFVRSMVRKAVESRARARGLTEITGEVVTEAKAGHGQP